MNPERVLETVCARLADDRESATRPATGPDPARVVALVRELLPLGTDADIARLADAAVAHVCGLGPLQRFLADPLVNEVMVNNGGEVWVERNGAIVLAGRLEAEVAPRVIERILAPLGRRLDRLSPIVDARLADGSRVCAVIPPIAVDGPCLAIRRFGVRRRPMNAFMEHDVEELLREMVAARCNIMISGATSSGKTSLLDALLSNTASPAGHERIVTLEDVAELQLDLAHVLRLETRPATVDGAPAITMTDLVRTALRLRPDRIVVGEIRGGEVVDMLAAMNTGHDGSLCTCHANGAVDAVRRVESLVVQHSPSWPLHAVRESIRSSIDVVIHVERRDGGQRRISEVLELARPDDDAPHRALVVGGNRCGALQRRRA